MSLIGRKKRRGEYSVKMKASIDTLVHPPGCSSLTAILLKQGILHGLCSVLGTSLACLEEDLHMNVCLVGQKQHKVVIFFNDKSIQTQPRQCISP